MKTQGNIHLVAKNGFLSYQPADYTTTYEMRTMKGLPKLPHWKLYNKVLACLRKIGYKVTKDPYIEKLFPSLSASHRYGKWRDLEVSIHVFPNGFKLEFYQNLVTVNCNGGKYDFDKFDKMPYLMQRAFLYTVGKVSALIEVNESVTHSCRNEPKEAAARALHNFQTSSFTRNKIQSLSEVDGMMSEYDHGRNSFDRDKKIIKCGEAKYFRDHSTGRLMRGIAYHNINNMWWVITSRFTLRNMGASDLFDATPGDLAQRRVRVNRMPKDKRAQLDFLASLSAGQLAKALSRRQKALATV